MEGYPFDGTYPEDLDRAIESLQQRRSKVAEQISKLNKEWDLLFAIEVEFKMEGSRRAYEQRRQAETEGPPLRAD